MNVEYSLYLVVLCFPCGEARVREVEDDSVEFSVAEEMVLCHGASVHTVHYGAPLASQQT